MSVASAQRSVPARSRCIFPRISPDRLAKVFEVHNRHHWVRHQLLFRAGDPATGLHKITAGVIAVSRAMPEARRQIMVFLFPGDICGLVQSDGRYSFDYEVIAEATTLAADMGRVSNLTSTNPDVADALKEKMLRAERRLTEQLVAVGQLNAKERVVYFLSRLRQSYAERGMPTEPLLLPMTRLEIADHLGMRIETLCRAFTGLKRQKLIDLPAANSVVLNETAGEFLRAANDVGGYRVDDA